MVGDYGIGEYGEGGYGNNDPPMTDIDFNEEINRRIDQRIDEAFENYDPPDSGGGGDGSDPLLSPEEAENVRRLLEAIEPAELAALVDRIDSGLETFESKMGLKARIGPPAPDEGHEHSTEGWGAVLTAHDPIRFREATVVSNQPGSVTAQLWAYEDGDVGDLIDSTTIDLPQAGPQAVDLDLKLADPDAAQSYLLTRDFIDDGDPGSDTVEVGLWRTLENWSGWGDVGDLLTLHTSAHPDWGGEPKYWYNFFDVAVEAYDPSESEGE